MKLKHLIVLGITLLTSAGGLLAQGSTFTYQGRLNSGGGAANGLYDFNFTLYDAASGGAQQGGAVLLPAVGVTNGLFTVALDFGNQFNGSSRWLDISVKSNGAAGYTPLTPRQELTPTPNAVYAARAGVATSATSASLATVASSVGNGAVGTTALQDGAVTAAKIGGGNVVKTVNALRDDVTLAAGPNVTVTPNGQTLTLASPTDWHLGGNAGAGLSFLGTTDNQPLELKVNSTRALRLGTDGSLATGNNTARGLYSTALGRSTTADGSYSTALGRSNVATNDDAVVMGYLNVSGGWSSTAMGSQTKATGNYSTAMGNGTTASGNYSIASGLNTTASGLYSTALGRGTVANNDDATAMGFGTTASGWDSTALGSQTKATGNYSTAMGRNTTAANDDATAMGFGTTASGWDSLALGTYSVANGHYSVAAGYYAQTTNQGSFVWADSSSTTPFISKVNNEFAVRAAGGVRLASSYLLVTGGGNEQAYMGGDGSGGDVEIGSRNAGIMNVGFWNAAAFSHMNLFALTFNPGSDRNIKQDFQTVDSIDILNKVIALPVTEWAYKTDQKTRHLGPVAQDFQAAFHLGSSDKSIATVDADGVALAAIQGLNQKLEARNAALEKELAEVKALVKTLAEKVNGVTQ